MLTTTLTDHQVLQRTDPQGAELSLTDLAGAPGRMVGLIASDGSVAAESSGDTLRMPTGGPYTITADGSPLATEVYVGDLWVLAGQSNMQGIGRLEDAEPPHRWVKTFDMTHRWRPATEPLHELFESVDKVHHGGLEGEALEEARRLSRDEPTGAGLGVPFANAMVATTGVPIGLVPTAHGGTSMAQWSPELKEQGGESLYGSMLNSVRAAGGRVAGLLWYQGESDTMPAPGNQNFSEDVRQLVSAFRKDLGDIPVFGVQLGCFVIAELDFDASWTLIREVQRNHTEVGFTAMTTAIDLPLDDPIHISTGGLKRLGLRLARLASGQRGLQVESVEVDRRIQTDMLGNEFVAGQVRVRYTGVTGGLQPVDHIAGFSLRDGRGVELPMIYRARVAPDDPSCVQLQFAGAVRDEETFLHYGWGRDPYCNLTDDQDMAAPAFGPWTVRV